MWERVNIEQPLEKRNWKEWNRIRVEKEREIGEKGKTLNNDVLKRKEKETLLREFIEMGETVLHLI